MRRSLHQMPEPPDIPEHELLRCIGWGSYGEVWLARHRATGAWHAVKLVYRESFDEDRPYEREFEGIRGCEPISHGHEGLIDILQVGRDDGAVFFYYVMELADDRERGREMVPEEYQARTLRSELMSRGQLSMADCLAHGRTLAHALAHLHGQGLVHRDIKPSNIVFVNGEPKLADVGLVTSMDATYSWVGTPGYIPQEGPGSMAADIFSLGKVVYEIATGKDRHDFPELPPDMTGMRYLNEVLLRACARRAEDRHATAAELATDFDRLIEGQPPLSAIRARRGRFAKLVAGLAVLGLAFLWADSRQPHLDRGLLLDLKLPGELQLSGPLPAENHRGDQGAALFFDGSDDVAEMPLPEVQGPDVTLAVWAKSLRGDSSGCIAGVFRGHEADGIPRGVWLEARAHGKFALRQRNFGETVLSSEAGSNLPLKGDGTWHHLVGVSEGGRLRLFVDGRLQSVTATVAPLEAGKGKLRLGTNGKADFFRGVIGRVRVYNRALTVDEAQRLFAKEQTVDALDGLVGHYPLDGAGEDISGGHRHLQLRGGALAADRHGLPARALGFDGVDDWAGITTSAAPTGNAPRTLALWARREADQRSDRTGVIMTGYAGKRSQRTSFGIDFLHTNGVARVRPGLAAAFPPEQWVHLAAAYDGTRTRFFVNGKSAGELKEQLHTGHPHLFLGVNALVLDDATYFRGALDGLRIYNRALSATELAGLWRLEKPVSNNVVPAENVPRLLFPNADFSEGTLKHWQVLCEIKGDTNAPASGEHQFVKLTRDAAAAGGYVAMAKQWEEGVTMLSPPITVTAANRILLARYCNPFGISSCSLVVVLKNHDRVLLENNDEPNLVEHRHDLKPWLGKTLRIGFSGGQMRMDYLKTLPGR